MKQWLLQTKILSGKGLNQVKVKELMEGNFNEENIDELNVAVSTLIEAGETKEYTDNVYLKLGVFEGENKEGAFGAYVDSFNGDDQNELFFMHQIEALELAGSGCNCGGKCSGHIDESEREEILKYVNGESDLSGNMHKLKEVKGILNSIETGGMSITADEFTLLRTIKDETIRVQQKVQQWREETYELNPDATVESVTEAIKSGDYSKWKFLKAETLDGTETDVTGDGTIVIFNEEGSELGHN